MTVSRTSKQSRHAVWLAAGVAAAALLAQAAPAGAKVGVAAAVNTDAKGRPPGEGARVISLGQTVVFNEEIETDGNGLVQVLLLDGTTFTVGPNSRLVIDEFVYNPATGDAKVVASVAKGAFRFIGGQTSRKPGGATIKTAVGTIGIRGAMVEGNVEPGGTTIFSMIFGREVLFTGNGGRNDRIYQPGYTMVVSGAGAGQTSRVRPRTADDASAFLSALAGRSGTRGGSSQQPTDTSVSSSPVPDVNTRLPRFAPLNTFRDTVIVSTPVEEIVTDNTIADQTIRDEVAQLPQNPGEPEPPPPPPPPPPGSKNLRIYTAPEIYIPLEDQPKPVAGSRGLIGSTPETDRTAVFSVANGRLISTGLNINLPDLTGTIGDGGLTAVNVTDAFGPNGPLSGIAYAGVGDFAAYLLGESGDATKPVYVIAGTKTDIAGLVALDTGTDVREYSLTPDPIRPTALPFFIPDLYGAASNSNATNLLVVEPGLYEEGDISTFLTWIDISGTGAGQKSAGLVYATSAGTDANGELALGGSRRGSFRANASGPAYNMRGDISTLPGPDGGHLFGPNGEHMVLGSSTNPADAYFDTSYDAAFTGNPADGYLGDGTATTHHVANLETQTPQASLSRTTRSFSGFMSGMAESTARQNGRGARMLGVDFPNLFGFMSAETNTVSAFAILYDVTDEDEEVEGYQLAFGPSETSGGGSTFVDDNRFGAVQNRDPNLTRLFTDEGDDYAHTTRIRPGSYFVSGKAAPIAGYQLCTNCDFIDWGWWGTRITIDADGMTAGPGSRSDYVHLGTWVAGDISDPATLPTTIVVDYRGGGLGTVQRFTEGGPITYIAKGDFGLTFDFNARQGSMDISNFDGMTLTGLVTDSSAGPLSLWRAALSGTDASGLGSSVYGSAFGAFVDNGSDVAAGAIGDFEITGSAVRAVGSVAGTRTGMAPARTVDVRVLTAPSAFQAADGNLYPAAGSRGLVGTTPEADREFAVSQIGGRLVSAAGGIDLPDLAAAGETGLERILVDGNGDGQNVSGYAYAGQGDFTAYLLGRFGSATDPYYMIRGTKTPDAVVASLFSGTDLRSYSLSADPIRNAPVPFFANDLYGTMTNYNSSDFMILESNTGTQWDTRAFQTWISIDGEGINQKSAIHVVGMGIGLEGSDTAMTGVRRGSFRYSAFAGPANMRSGVSTMAGPDGGQLFGEDLNNFVLGASIPEREGFSDSLLGPGFTGNENDGYLGGGYPFSTHHVGDLVAKTPLSSLTRTTRTVSGFMTGIGESTSEGVYYPYLLASGSLPTTTLETNATHGWLTMRSTVADVFDQNAIVNNMLLTFGPTSNSGGSGTFINDAVYGASFNADQQNTRLRTDGGQDIANLATDNPGSYMVSGKATPLTNYQHCVQCDFVDWGWWGTRVRVAGDGSEITDPQRSDLVHMGTWVAGDITNPNDLPTGITVDYVGTALGNVTRVNSAGVGKYIAKGDMQMSFDFNSRTGNVAITNFDGMAFGGAVGETSTTTQALFGGSLSGSDLSGNISGAFVNDGPNVAAGVIGNFGAVGTGVTVTGTIAGAAYNP